MVPGFGYEIMGFGVDGASNFSVLTLRMFTSSLSI
jgi:hypothetical protein